MSAARAPAICCASDISRLRSSSSANVHEATVQPLLTGPVRILDSRRKGGPAGRVNFSELARGDWQGMDYGRGYALGCRAAHVRDRSFDECRHSYATSLLPGDRAAAVHAQARAALHAD